MEWIKKHKTFVISAVSGLAAVIAIVIVWAIIASYTIAVRNEGETYEKRLTTLYNTSLLSLSTCLDQGRVAAQVTEREYESVKDILVDVTGARYFMIDGEQTNASEALGGGRLISALTESYPQIDQRSWQNLQILVIGCRDEVQGTQERLQFEAANYNTWRIQDDIFNGGIKADFPSDELVVTKSDGTTLYGRSAYEQIIRVPSVEGAQVSFDTGQMVEQDLSGDDE